MTGCPAWYDLDKIEAQALFRRPVQGNIDHIAISDLPDRRTYRSPVLWFAMWSRNCNLARSPLCSTGDGRAINTQGGYLATCQQNLKTWLDRQRIDVCGIEYSNEGFGVYNDTDMHIGFRVHAHIYNMSQRHPSFFDRGGWQGVGA